MSVIYGIAFFKDQRDVEAVGNELSLMENSLNHWNADDTGKWNNHIIGLGHLMLYNTPESLQERLPLHNSISALTITADARIDNRAELFKKLDINHAEQADIPDSSLILKTYEKYGEDCVLHLIGDFAFAIYDEKKQKLFCARDHMGVKPFFYYIDNNGFAFASEKKGILALPKVDKSINPQFFYNKLILFNEQSFDSTLYKEVKKIPPAHTLSISITNNQLSLKCYWTLDAFNEVKLNNNEEYYEQLLFHFDEAVKCRTRTAFPIGAELSGGLDSSAITGAAQCFLNQNGQNLITFSNALPEEISRKHPLYSDERQYIDEVIAFNHIKDYVYVTKGIRNDRLAEIDFELHVDDGLETWNSGWQAPGKKAAFEKNVRTLLSGFPGDEMVTSSSKVWFLDHFDNNQFLAYFRAVSKSREVFNLLSPVIPHQFKYLLKTIRNNMGFYDDPIKAASEIYNIPDKYKKKINDYLWHYPVYAERLKSYRHWQKYILLKPMVTHRLESETRYGLYFKTEPRFPMADIRLTQFFSAMPNHLKYGGPLGRDLFRNAVKKYLPPAIRQRVSKHGSIAPFLQLQEGGKDVYKKVLQELPENKLLKKTSIIENIETDHSKEMSKKDWKNKRSLPTLDVIRWLQKNPEAFKEI